MGADPPLGRQFRRHPSELPSSVHRFRIRQVACYPPGTGNAQIRPSMSPTMTLLDSFPIPMRGNELDGLLELLLLTLMFPIPMRGNEIA